MNIPYVVINSLGKLDDFIPYSEFVRKLWKMFPDERLEICHAAMGVCGEAGELCDALKKAAIYGKELDRDNVVEELGDLRFFMQAIMNRYQITDVEVLDANANKLSDRYKGLVYTDEAAIARADKLAIEDELTKYVNCESLAVLGIRCYRIASTMKAGRAGNFIPEEYLSPLNAKDDTVEGDTIWIEYVDGTYELMP
jgi:NTP pyrophosphatase (non-canonical NTP hydrolase)